MAEITIEVNGQPRRLPAPATVLDLLAELRRDPRTVAVEHNGRIVPRAHYADTALLAGDRVEVVHFVQGGGGGHGGGAAAASAPVPPWVIICAASVGR